MFKLETLDNTHRNRVRTLEKHISDAYDELVRRMRTSKLESVEADFLKKKDGLKLAQSRADNHTALWVYCLSMW